MVIPKEIVEARISEAMERGEFDDLPGAGRPLQSVDQTMVPESLRMAFKILKNAGVLPPEVETRQEISRLEDMLPNMKDEAELLRAMKRLNALRLKLSTLGLGRRTLCFDAYQHQSVVQRLMRRPRR